MFLPRPDSNLFMSFCLDSQLLLDDDLDDVDDFDPDFDEDYEYLSDEEFEVSIEDDEYESNDIEVPSGFCLDDDLEGFGDFDADEDTMTERDYADEE